MKEYVKIYRNGRKATWHCYEYRKEPVPRTGRCVTGGYYKKPRTTQERRASILTEEEIYYGIQIRGRRKLHNLVNSYDDRIRPDLFYRNWKRQRRTQYKIR